MQLAGPTAPCQPRRMRVRILLFVFSGMTVSASGRPKAGQPTVAHTMYTICSSHKFVFSDTVAANSYEHK